MTTRHDDIDLLTDAIPPDKTVIYGQRLMLTARSIKCPYGDAHTGKTAFGKRNVVGIIVSKADRKRMVAAIARKAEANEAKSKRAE